MGFTGFTKATKMYYNFYEVNAKWDGCYGMGRARTLAKKKVKKAFHSKKDFDNKMTK